MENSENKHVRFSKGLSAGESLAVEERKMKCAEALGKLPGMYISEDQVPVIAVLGSGGGVRAMLSLLGSLSGLQEIGVLDCVTYICGVSGSTWAMSSLCENPEWTKDLESLTKDICSKIVRQDASWEKIIDIIFEEERLRKRLVEAARKNDFSLTDIWAAAVSYLIGKENTHFLSSHQKSVKRGMNPYPVYAAIDKEAFDINQKFHPEIWFEFTPHECGFPYYEAFIETCDFGSKFEDQTVTKSHPELDVCHLQGIWGSAMAHEETLRQYVKDKVKDLWKTNVDCDTDLVDSIFDSLHGEVEQEMGNITEYTMNQIEEACADDDEFSQFLNKTKDALLNWKFGTSYNYLHGCQWFKKQDKNLKNINNVIKKEFVSLVDAGLAINCAYPLMLHPKRKVDVIISLDYSDGDIFETLTLAKEFAKENHLHFPSVNKEDKQPEDCSVYSDTSTPTVIHMPLFNKVNKNEATIDNYPTLKSGYTQEEVDKLLKIAKENVTRNKEKILKAIKNKKCAQQIDPENSGGCCLS
ncbi:cytosolic phospholipase A2 gamma-like [Polypterus senegalus]|uniref:cytosolic phospholipase A2 gamma-like n=1 Tax=Polypterus senegalus TaxID=55291 RepID=UPI001964226E|nr:cytosolic phospholipase A2 gamma-like [Polypterus senegalus]XP_039605448.1 cytosolic phospholipase A2 gamma-like [Polypterus senegalus]